MSDEQPQQDSAPAEVPAEAATDAASVPVASEHNADSAGGEAARYRHKLRDTEKQLDSATQRIESMQRGEVERLAASKLADPGDVWRDGAQLTDVLDEAGNIDPGKVNELLDGLTQAHAHWARKQPTLPSGGLKSGASKPADYRPASWASALRSTD